MLRIRKMCDTVKSITTDKEIAEAMDFIKGVLKEPLIFLEIKMNNELTKIPYTISELKMFFADYANALEFLEQNKNFYMNLDINFSGYVKVSDNVGTLVFHSFSWQVS